MTPRAEVVAEARRWLGTRWLHRGRVLGAGVDCAGLVIGVAQRLGLSRFDIGGYARTPSGGLLRATCAAQMAELPLAAAQAGDVALLRWETEPQHLAILGDHPAGTLTLIHAWAQARHVVEHRLDAAWRARLVAAYALPGVG